MRKLLLITSLLIAATSAQASQTRGLLTTASNMQTAQLQAPEPKLSVSEQLNAAGELPKPAAESAAAPVSAPAVQTTVAPAAAVPVASPATAPAASQPLEAKAEAAPSKKRAKKATVQRRETDEQKARRIASRYGVSW